jgi:hypothetical protein
LETEGKSLSELWSRSGAVLEEGSGKWEGGGILIKAKGGEEDFIHDASLGERGERGRGGTGRDVDRIRGSGLFLERIMQ